MKTKNKDKNNTDDGIKVYENEKSDKFEVVTDDEFIDLIKENKLSYSVYKKIWFYITVAIILLFGIGYVTLN